MTQTSKPTLTTRTADGGVLVLCVGGEWSLQQPAPSWEDLESHFQEASKPSKVQFEMSGLGAYDSSLISLLVDLVKGCQQKSISLDTRGLPEGVHQLIQMALAVPEKKTHQTSEAQPFFTRVGKAGLTLGAGVMEVFAFIGVSAGSFGRLFRGKAVYRKNDTWLIIQRAGAEALPIVTLINFLIGVIIGFVGGMELKTFGASIYMADLV